MKRLPAVSGIAKQQTKTVCHRNCARSALRRFGVAAAKGKTMRFWRGQAHNLAVENELKGHNLEPLAAFKDLGVALSPELKPHDQRDLSVKKARSATFLIRLIYPRKCGRCSSPT